MSAAILASKALLRASRADFECAGVVSATRAGVGADAADATSATGATAAADAASLAAGSGSEASADAGSAAGAEAVTGSAAAALAEVSADDALSAAASIGARRPTAGIHCCRVVQAPAAAAARTRSSSNAFNGDCDFGGSMTLRSGVSSSSTCRARAGGADARWGGAVRIVAWIVLS